MKKQLNDKRRLWKFIIFGMLTGGIYMIVFLWQMVNDLNTVCGYVESNDDDRSPHYLVMVLFSFLTLGIYMFFWYYKQGNRIRRCGQAYGLQIDETGSTYLLWTIFGSFLFGIGPLISIYLFIGNLNKLCTVYNYKNSVPEQSVQTPPRQIPEKPVRDSITVREDTFDVKDDRVTRPLTMMGRIRCIKGSLAGAEIELPSGKELMIGRNGAIAQLVLPEGDISRKHCSIRYQSDDQFYYVTDFSTYGVQINDSQSLEKGIPTRVPQGSKLTLGTGSNVFTLM